MDKDVLGELQDIYIYLFISLSIPSLHFIFSDLQTLVLFTLKHVSMHITNYFNIHAFLMATSHKIKCTNLMCIICVAELH